MVGGAAFGGHEGLFWEPLLQNLHDQIRFCEQLPIQLHGRQQARWYLQDESPWHEYAMLWLRYLQENLHGVALWKISAVAAVSARREQDGDSKSSLLGRIGSAKVACQKSNEVQHHLRCRNHGSKHHAYLNMQADRETSMPLHLGGVSCRLVTVAPHVDLLNFVRYLLLL